ncbi:hypothetical protein [Methanotorris formicicus]|uniref:Uncharacterized protein n=1 Tax=Methanotorris formicicus Mc-S-70 TaxID=647171 RepID=H1KY29_9EURY|nr:hypothetical protein [Methanotorris formicicus]EHP87581.1 hypothetical protein MetfoDRAFT_0702 [Methanotorris formicicus Mc-S-70]
MPYGYGVSMQSAGNHLFGGGIIVDYILLILMIVIILMLAYQMFKKSNADNERLVKMEKDVEEIKETVKELKKKWEEIE